MASLQVCFLLCIAFAGFAASVPTGLVPVKNPPPKIIKPDAERLTIIVNIECGLVAIYNKHEGVALVLDYKANLACIVDLRSGAALILVVEKRCLIELVKFEFVIWWKSGTSLAELPECIDPVYIALEELTIATKVIERFNWALCGVKDDSLVNLLSVIIPTLIEDFRYLSAYLEESISIKLDSNLICITNTIRAIVLLYKEFLKATDEECNYNELKIDLAALLLAKSAPGVLAVIVKSVLKVVNVDVVIEVLKVDLFVILGGLAGNSINRTPLNALLVLIKDIFDCHHKRIHISALLAHLAIKTEIAAIDFRGEFAELIKVTVQYKVLNQIVVGACNQLVTDKITITAKVVITGLISSLRRPSALSRYSGCLATLVPVVSVEEAFFWSIRISVYAHIDENITAVVKHVDDNAVKCLKQREHGVWINKEVVTTITLKVTQKVSEQIVQF